MSLFLSYATVRPAHFVADDEITTHHAHAPHGDFAHRRHGLRLKMAMFFVDTSIHSYEPISPYSSAPQLQKTIERLGLHPAKHNNVNEILHEPARIVGE